MERTLTLNLSLSYSENIIKVGCIAIRNDLYRTYAKELIARTVHERFLRWNAGFEIFLRKSYYI
jgi:hypothetical protein